ncbi:hypothetical protein JTB14_005892 [Gonioctena quinquepunctata]|nr:hypothetical protein JTB14_005892 [Gonioctena quinquepunctata]
MEKNIERLMILVKTMGFDIGQITVGNTEIAGDEENFNFNYYFVNVGENYASTIGKPMTPSLTRHPVEKSFSQAPTDEQKIKLAIDY